MNYLTWDIKKITDFSDKFVTEMYDRGYVFTRIETGTMHQTRSIRINLKEFSLTSENRRILRKGENISLNKNPIPYVDYSWDIAKIAKDFYDKKTDHAFSANKIKELIAKGCNFNTLLTFTEDTKKHGYAICYENNSMIHYSYPFYDIEKSPKDMGLIMMTKVIADAKFNNISYVYLGSLQRPNDTYKLQFEGLEWFDGEKWSTDQNKVREILATNE